MSDIASHLNESQRAVVYHDGSALLVLAAAGTGKTETLTTRIAHMIHVRNIPPREILAVTFSKKAAKEMRTRAARIASIEEGDLNIGTFHSLCCRMLRTHPIHRKYDVMDNGDSLRFIRQVAKDQGIDVSSWGMKPENIMHQMNTWKNDGLDPDDVIIDSKKPQEKDMLSIYQGYRRLCDQFMKLDFGDLLLITVRHLKKDDAFRKRWRGAYKHVLVDEFQDTNVVQLQLIKHLVSDTCSIMAVGDDSQAIHEWRGACVKNMMSFGQHFPGAKMLKLELNYRSVGHVLTAANNIIRHNSDVLDKKLLCTKEEGDPIQLHTFADDTQEANIVARMIAEQVAGNTTQSRQYKDFVILYRINAMSLNFEKALKGLKIPFQIKGGMSFFEREEIKLIVSYLRLASNPKSDADFVKVLNTPSRGIGEVSLQKIKDLAAQDKTSLFEAAICHESMFTGKTRSGLHTFFRIFKLGIKDKKEIQDVQEVKQEKEKETCIGSKKKVVKKCIAKVIKKPKISTIPEFLTIDTLPFTNACNVYEVIQGIVRDAAILELYKNEEERKQNIEKLLAVVRKYEKDSHENITDPTKDNVMDTIDPVDKVGSLAKMLSDLILDVDESDESEIKQANNVTLMTIHASKGLEYPVVFLTGMGEESMPFFYAIQENKMDAERRLAYVGITRAKEHLFLTHPKMRYKHYGPVFQEESRFIKEMEPVNMTRVIHG